MKDLSFFLNISEEFLSTSLLFSDSGFYDKDDSKTEYLPPWTFRTKIKHLTGAEVSEEDAVDLYSKIVSRQNEMMRLLNRNIDIRTAAMDYFINSNLSIVKNPRIIDTDDLDKVLKSCDEDPKTGCYNAKFLNVFLEKEFYRARRYCQKFSVIMIDIDNFKQVNDTYGHLFGDRILQLFSKVLLGLARKEDVVARFGGDEFSIVLPQTGRIGARCLAERIKHKMENVLIDDGFQNISFSAGIATYPMDAEDVEGLVVCADSALYQSKKHGKNCINGYSKLNWQNNISCNNNSMELAVEV